MTEQEAIKSMKNLNMVLSITDSERESVNMAIKALDKQIPKKPIAAQNNGFYCPVCNERVDDDGRGYQQPYCYKCGQAIDWKE